MGVERTRIYKDGKLVGINPDPAPNIDQAEFGWTTLRPNEQAAIDRAAAALHLHPIAQEDARNPQSAAIAEVYRGQVFISARAAFLLNDRIAYQPVTAFTGDSHIVVITEAGGRVETDWFRRFEDNRDDLDPGAYAAVYAVLVSIVATYAPVLEAIEDRVIDMETQVFADRLDKVQINALFELRRELVLFRRVVGPFSDAIGRLARNGPWEGGSDIALYFKDISYQLERTEGMLDGLWEVVSSAFEVSNLLEQQRQGDAQRKLAAWAAIVAIPTAIAGIYGMNFKNMPELSSPWGYPVTLGVMTAVCLLLYVGFRRSKWL